MVNCTFSGHRAVYGSGVEERLFSALERLLEEDKEFYFYVGGMGEFDTMGARAVRVLKKRHPEKKIQLYLVLPYMKRSVNEDSYWKHFMMTLLSRWNWQDAIIKAPLQRETAGSSIGATILYASSSGILGALIQRTSTPRKMVLLLRTWPL